MHGKSRDQCTYHVGARWDFSSAIKQVYFSPNRVFGEVLSSRTRATSEEIRGGVKIGGTSPYRGENWGYLYGGEKLGVPLLTVALIFFRILSFEKQPRPPQVFVIVRLSLGKLLLVNLLQVVKRTNTPTKIR